jgi:hypothetical protein
VDVDVQNGTMGLRPQRFVSSGTSEALVWNITNLPSPEILALTLT